MRSPGTDEIPNVVWKEFAFELSPALADIYNSSLEQGYFPTQLKQAIVVPVPKTRPPKSVENELRPISLTSPIAKLLEGFCAESLITSVFNKLDNKQFALPGRSTTQALIFFMHTILEAQDTCGRYIRIFFSDFSKGFDLVDHNVLLSELNNLDADPNLVRWIAAFLTNRSQRVRIGNSLSPPIGLNGWTPQGTKRAPLLFCILVNGMAVKCKCRIKYVDDATAMEIIPRCSPSYLPFTVSDIYTYASLRGMKLNSKKCKEMIINFMQYSPFPPAPLTVGGSVIERVLTYKLLGVYISEDLSWNVHIEHIVKKANKRLYALRTLKESNLTIMQLVQVYCSIVRSVLEYACPVWAALPKYLDDAIESVQFYILLKESVVSNSFDIFTIPETWLDSSVNNESIHIPGCTLYRQDRGPHKLGGGLCVYIKKNYKVSSMENVSSVSDNHFQQLWLKVQSRCYKSFVICTVYRPPSTPLNFTDDLANSLIESLLLGLDVIILGDLNCNLLRDNAESLALNDFCSTVILTQLINKPTRFTENGESFIDVVMTTNEKLIASNEVLMSTISDHNLVHISLKLKMPRIKPCCVTTRSYTNYNVDNFLRDLSYTPFHIISLFDDFNDQVDVFNELFLEVLNQHAPVKRFKMRSKPNPLITPEIRQLMRTRDQWRKLAGKTNDPLHWNGYRFFRQEVKREICVAEKVHVRTQILDSKGNSTSIGKSSTDVYHVNNKIVLWLLKILLG